VDSEDFSADESVVEDEYIEDVYYSPEDCYVEEDAYFVEDFSGEEEEDLYDDEGDCSGSKFSGEVFTTSCDEDSSLCSGYEESSY